MEALMELNPVKFKYKADKSGEEYLGFIAENVPALGWLCKTVSI